ncbi:MAG: Bug family tripartite tricarboxylate transporter substrate binding protein [Rhodospirillaceae bacterium]
MSRTRLSAVLLSLFAATAVHAQGADTYPNRPVRILVGFAAGGANDIVTRIVSQKLTESWGQTIVVDNRGGAGGNIAGELAAKAAPDGYTLFMTSGSIVCANQHIYRKMPFDPEKDLIGITNVVGGPQLVAVNASAPWKTLKEFIAAAKAKPKSITLGSAGFGTQTHLAAENFMSAAGIDANHIPYKGEAPALTDLVAGQIQFVTPNMAAAIGFVQQGKLRALAVTSKQRSKKLPDVPAVAETVPGFENLGWFGLMAPTGTPRAIVDKVYNDTLKAVQSADVKARFEQLGMEPIASKPADFARQLKQESAMWAKIVKERHLVIE